MSTPASDLRSEYPSASERERRRWRRGWTIAAVATVLLHLSLLLFRSPAPEPPWAAAGLDRDDELAMAGGGQEMEQVQVRVQPEEEPEEIIPVPDPVEIEVEIDDLPDDIPEDAVEMPDFDVPGVGEAEGDDEGPGVDDGTGSGASGADADGAGSGVAAPVPRGMILPPGGEPSSVRGREITVWVFVSADGRVAADSTRLEPSTGNRRYDRRLIQSAADWSFDPARRGGQPIGAWYPYEVIF